MVSKKILLGTFVVGSFMIGQNVCGMWKEPDYKPKYKSLEEFLKTNEIDNVFNRRKDAILKLFKNFVGGFEEMLSEDKYLNETYTKENRELIENQDIEALKNKNFQQIEMKFEKIQTMLKKVYYTNIITNRDLKTRFLQLAFNMIMDAFYPEKDIKIMTLEEWTGKK